MFDGQLTTVHHGHEASLSEVFPSREARDDHEYHVDSPADTYAQAFSEPPPHKDHGDREHTDHGGEGGGHIMSMFFHAGKTETILFKFWRTDSAWEIGVSCLIVFLIAVFYEGLKFYREWLFENKKRRLQGGRDQYGPPRRYREHNHNYNQPTYTYRMPPQNQQMQAQTQIYTYRPAPPSMPSSIPPPMPPPMPPLPPDEMIVSHIQEPSPEAGGKVPWRRRLCSRMHLFQTFLHVLQVFISFLLMLVFMTFNVWLCVSVLLGAGFGYFIFCAFSTRINEHCN